MSATELSRADGTRQRLLDAAVRAFAERGFHGTTTRDVAAAAGMSPAALYVHHKSKEDLLYLISRQGHEDTLQLVRRAIASADDPVGQLRRVIGDFAEHHARDRTSARTVNYELAALSPEHLEEIRGTRHDIEEEVRDLVSRGVAAGVFSVVDPAMSAAALLSLGFDLARWYHDGSRWTPEEIGRHYSEIGLRVVGATSEPTR